jgi:hypothetical protein
MALAASACVTTEQESKLRDPTGPGDVADAVVAGDATDELVVASFAGSGRPIALATEASSERRSGITPQCRSPAASRVRRDRG